MSMSTYVEQNIGFLHPGVMGAALASSARERGCQVYWVGEGRSLQTRERARAAGMHELATVAELCSECAVIVGICPPHAAKQIATDVARSGYQGIFIEANAIAPGTVMEIEGIITHAGGQLVDASIIGEPPTTESRPTLLLSGPAADKVADFFAGAFEVECIGEQVGHASAVKSCDSAVHKGLFALLLASLATAEQLDVRTELERLWASKQYSLPYLRSDSEHLRRAAKAWRFAGEMDEIAATFASAGLPDTFHRAAAEVFRRLSDPADLSDMEHLLHRLSCGQKAC